MDLALHLGMTEAQLRAQMTERELQRWQLYRVRRMLPLRRIELYLAQVAHTVSLTWGGKRAFDDFLFDPAPDAQADGDDDEDDPSVEDIAEQFGVRLSRAKKG